MAITQTARLGITRWSAQTDALRRTQLDADASALEANVAMFAQGTFNARPAAGKAGRFYYSTDTGATYYDTGTAWVPVIPEVWQPYTPGAINFALGAGGSLTGKFCQIGKTVHFRINVSLGTGFAFNAGLAFSVPVTAAAGTFLIWSSCTDQGSANYFLFPDGSLNYVFLYYIGANGIGAAISATAPFVWAAGDTISIAGTYEAA